MTYPPKASAEHSMIADVLTDAIKDIDRLRAEYQDDEALHEEIRELQLRMRLLQMQLDKPPARKFTTEKSSKK